LQSIINRMRTVLKTLALCPLMGVLASTAFSKPKSFTQLSSSTNEVKLLQEERPQVNDNSSSIKVFDDSKHLRWLVCLAHPDDESGICAWIKHLTDQGCEVFMSWSHDTPIRKQEAINVAKTLGVPEKNLYFFGGPDGKIVEHIPELIVKHKKMIDEVKPDRIITLAFEQGHMDHDATNYMVNKCFDGPVFEFPLYHTYLTKTPPLNRFAQRDGHDVFHLNREQQKLKIQVAKSYPSQTLWRNVYWYSIMLALQGSSDRIYRRELMRLQTHKNFLEPHLPKRLATRVRNGNSWKRWTRNIEKHQNEQKLTAQAQTTQS
jgi:LmbE family N-acetylglucosaminyl deacetylase